MFDLERMSACFGTSTSLCAPFLCLFGSRLAEESEHAWRLVPLDLGQIFSVLLCLVAPPGPFLFARFHLFWRLSQLPLAGPVVVLAPGVAAAPTVVLIVGLVLLLLIRETDL